MSQWIYPAFRIPSKGFFFSKAERFKPTILVCDHIWKRLSQILSLRLWALNILRWTDSTIKEASKKDVTSVKPGQRDASIGAPHNRISKILTAPLPSHLKKKEITSNFIGSDCICHFSAQLINPLSATCSIMLFSSHNNACIIKNIFVMFPGFKSQSLLYMYCKKERLWTELCGALRVTGFQSHTIKAAHITPRFLSQSLFFIQFAAPSGFSAHYLKRRGASNILSSLTLYVGQQVNQTKTEHIFLTSRVNLIFG